MIKIDLYKVKSFLQWLHLWDLTTGETFVLVYLYYLTLLVFLMVSFLFFISLFLSDEVQILIIKSLFNIDL